MKRVAFRHFLKWGRTSAVLSLIFISVTSLLAEDEKPETGRYQIFSGTIEVLNQSGKGVSSERIPVVIKIDTKTGDTWILVTIFSNDSGGQGWQGLGEYRPKKK